MDLAVSHSVSVTQCDTNEKQLQQFT
eukprot:COSAG06_NODE_4404_length_4293_cov_4.212685_1_plen_25_part_10